VTADWIFACRDSPSKEAPPELDYRVPHRAFVGLSVTVSGYQDISVRQRLEQDVVAGGGVFTKELREDTTHLLMEEGCGDKYDAAVKTCTIAIVNRQWCAQCSMRGMLLPVGEFPPLAACRGGARGSNGTGPGSGHAAHAPRSAKDNNGHPVAAAAVAEAPSADAVALTIDIEADTQDGQYLDACIVHICKFDVSLRRTLLKLLRRGGGTRLDNCDDTVTHIVAPTGTSR
jgi:topoisomerase (DNA) II binding protein 1